VRVTKIFSVKLLFEFADLLLEDRLSVEDVHASSYGNFLEGSLVVGRVACHVWQGAPCVPHELPNVDGGLGPVQPWHAKVDQEHLRDGFFGLDELADVLHGAQAVFLDFMSHPSIVKHLLQGHNVERLIIDYEYLGLELNQLLIALAQLYIEH